MSLNEYVILEVVEEKAQLKEKGFYKVDQDIIRFYPDKEIKNEYSFRINYEKLYLESIDSLDPSNAWQYDEESWVSVKVGWHTYAIEKVGNDYLETVK